MILLVYTVSMNTHSADHVMSDAACSRDALVVRPLNRSWLMSVGFNRFDVSRGNTSGATDHGLLVTRTDQPSRVG